MGLEKNQEFILTIEDMGNEGEGIGHVDGMAVFVKDTVPEDIARMKILKVKKNYAYGKLLEIIRPSQHRVEPICPHAQRCGGCTIMHINYKKQLAWKQEKVKNCLQRIGKVTDIEAKMEPILGMESFGDFPAIRYRNKAQFPVRRDKEGRLAIGFYAGRTHAVIDTDVCYLQDESNDAILRKFRRFMEEYEVEAYKEETHTGLVRHILTRVGKRTGEIMVCLILNGKELLGKTKSRSGKQARRNVENEFIECMRKIPGIVSIILNTNQEKTNRILGKECRTLWGKDYIVDYIPYKLPDGDTVYPKGIPYKLPDGDTGYVQYQISPLSFYQVNPRQTEKLYEKVLEYADLQGHETVWDLYCGIGTISLFLAQRAKKVCGVEIVPEAIEDARKNAAINGLQNVEFFVGKAEEVLPKQYEKTRKGADVIVVDPPRKGCDFQTLSTILQMSPAKIVYVSCDPATLARDIEILTTEYEVKKVCAVDQFGHSDHVETICKLVRK